MSSKFTGDAQPEAGPGDETDQTLPSEIVENMAGSRSAPGSAAEPAPGEPTAVTVGPDGGAASGERPAGEGEGRAEDGAEDRPEDAENLAEWPDPAEATELMAMTEPVDMAEPVDMDGPVRQRRPRRRWHTAAIVVGFLVAAVAIVAGAIAIVGSLTHGFKKPVIIHYTKSAVFSLKAGECIDPNGQTATIVSCSAPHDAEVFATFALPGSKWPGTAAVGTAASSGCSSRLSGYLNPQLAISLSSTYIYPDAVAWRAGTRTVICEVRATQGQLTGSVRGANATAG